MKTVFSTRMQLSSIEDLNKTAAFVQEGDQGHPRLLTTSPAPLP
jgi:hypothetical protein